MTEPTAESVLAQISEKPDIYSAITAAKARIGVIGKDDRNSEQNYSFRGIDSVLNKAGPILTELGVVISPKHRVVSDSEVTARSGTKGYRVVIETRWTFAVSLGSFVRAQTIGEAIDYSDKAFNKAQTQSFKNALVQVLSIPTGEPDPDSESPERGEDITTAEQILRTLIADYGFQREQARSYARRAMEALALDHPVPIEEVQNVIEEAVELRQEDESPFEGGPNSAESPDETSGS